MRRFISAMAASLFFFMAGQASSSDNLSNGVLKIESGIIETFDGIKGALSLAAKETGNAGINREDKIRILLQNTMTGRSYAVDATFVDSKGIMKIIEPKEYQGHEGSDISEQAAVIKMKKTQMPVMGDAFISVEGIKSVDIEYPIFSEKKQLIGSISILFKHDEMIRAVAETIEKDMGIRCFVMQKDGLILYDTDEAQSGLNLFTDPLYKDYPELIALGKRMCKEKEGEGGYTFITPEREDIVKKRAAWKTINFFNNDWIIVAYGEVKQVTSSN